MSQYFQIHPVNPQLRLLRQAVSIIRRGGVIVYPTDSAYALGWQLGEHNALARIRQVRELDAQHNFTLVCSDLSQISTYAKVDNGTYRLLRSLTPGPFTFILEATREVPRRLLHPKRRSIGVRIPENRVALALLEELGAPIMSSTLWLPGDDLPMTEPWEMRERLEHHVDLVIDGGPCGIEPTTVIGLTGERPEILRQGRGSAPDVESVG